MMMSREEKVEELRNSGIYPVVSLDFFDAIKKIDFTKQTLKRHKNVEEFYKYYLERIQNLEERKKEPFLKAVEAMEVVDNQALEKEDSFLMQIYNQMDKESAIDYLRKNINDGLNEEIFIQGHKILLEGTKNDRFADKDYRTDNMRFVGCKEKSGEIYVSYFPIDYKKIKEAVGKLIDFYNNSSYDEQLFIKPQIIHALIACLQLFDDGNTRYGRILQNLKLKDLTDKNLKIDFGRPAFYGTRAYFPFREKYRSLLGELAKSPSNENWNEWFNFNLNRMEDAMLFMDDKLDEYSKVKI